MKIKGDTIQIQDTNGKYYSIPLEDLTSLIVYTDDHWETRHTDTNRNIRFSIKYVRWFAWGSEEIPYDAEIAVSKEDYEQLRDYLGKNKSFAEPRLSNVYKITYSITDKGANLDDNK